MTRINTTPLRTDPCLLDRLEEDLLDKIENIVNASDIASRLYGVFSVDDLEAKEAKELGTQMAIGVGYMGSRNQTNNNAPDKGNVADLAEYRYMVLIACPVDPLCSERPDATRLLSLLRNNINNTDITDSTRTQRRWKWVEEAPQISESDNTMLYYTQVWRIVLPVLGN